MARKVIKLLPDRLIFTSKIEQWLHDMAAEGLILKNMYSHFAVFEELGQQELYYRIVTFEEDYFVNEIIEQYENAGWYVAVKKASNLPFGKINAKAKFKIFKSENNDAPPKELYAFYDKTFLEDRYNAIKKSNKWNMPISIVFTLGALVSFIFFPIMYLPSVFLMVAIALLIISLIEQHYINRIIEMESESENSDIDTYEKSWRDYQPEYTRRAIIYFICMLMVTVFSYGFGFARLLFYNEIDSSKVQHFISLEAIQQDEIFNDSKVYGSAFPTPFVPTYYEAKQYADVYIDDEKLDIYYSMYYNKTIIPYVSLLTFNSCVRHQIERDDIDDEVNYTESEHFDKIAYSDVYRYENGHVYICFANEFELIYIYYEGNKAPQEIIDAVDETLYK